MVFQPVVKRDAGSVWDAVKGGPKRSWSHWPNPFGWIDEILMMACEDDIWIKVKMYGMLAGSFFFSNFVPSPVEISRKLVTGAYKCGFYLPIKAKSPLDLIWTDGRTSAVLRGKISPVTTGAFYFWAASTAFAAMDTWHTIQIALAKCDAVGNECVLIDGENFYPGTDPAGSPGFYTEVYDPEDRYQSPGGSVRFEKGALSVFVHGTIVVTGNHVTGGYVTLWPTHLNAPVITVPEMDGSGVFKFAVEFNGIATQAGDVQCYASLLQQNGSPFGTLLSVQSFIVNNKPIDTTHPRQLESPPNDCYAKNQPPFIMPTDLS